MSIKTCLDLEQNSISKKCATFLIQQDIFDKQSQIDTFKVLKTTQKGEESNTSFEHKPSYNEELPSTSSKKISTYRNKEEGITQEDVLNSVSKVSDTFRETKFPVYYEKLKLILHTQNAKMNYYIIDLRDEEILNQVHELLSDYKLNFLFVRLSLTDENECISEEVRRYMTLFDEIIEKKSCDDNDIEFKNNDIIDERNSKEFEKAIAKMKGKVHQLDSLSKKFHYLSNTFLIPAKNYDQSEIPDIFIIKSISSHLDTITKINGLMRNTSERT
ncbi:2478_t:CDS:2 [Funneliformis caledonium]|uniref:2478_t:CDS:1 n=1 Tax=Funneliformis caledonium TaxID=1117310 RepID=A0A9N9AJD3_9GLOM|nr:2478_t:CDS:2 [Funneliformis caledonium]